jgi:zinc D-Ala-D-Ala carboxypeptidase
MEKISEHVSYSEAIKSQTGIRMQIDNTPNEDQLKAMKLVAEKIFEPVRKAMNRPVFISSFFRSPILNQAIGGAKDSQHSKGEAIDIDVDGFNNEIFHFIKNNLVWDQLIWEYGDTNEPDWVHVSYKEGGNRKQVLRVTKTGTIPFDL